MLIGYKHGKNCDLSSYVISSLLRFTIIIKPTFTSRCRSYMSPTVPSMSAHGTKLGFKAVFAPPILKQLHPDVT